MNTKFASMEGNACRYNDSEAWWFVDEQNRWIELSAASVHNHAKMLTEAEFKSEFPQLPPLPSDAFHSDPSLSRAE